MGTAFVSDNGVSDTIQATLENGIDFARAQLPKGESLHYCLECDSPIPEKRRVIIPGVKYCVQCQSTKDIKLTSPFNRRGSKDSQLR